MPIHNKLQTLQICGINWSVTVKLKREKSRRKKMDDELNMNKEIDIIVITLIDLWRIL